MAVKSTHDPLFYLCQFKYGHHLSFRQWIHLHLEFLKCSTRSFLKFYYLAGFILQSCTWDKNHFAGNLEDVILIVFYTFHYGT